jgi:hypothetical protein
LTASANYQSKKALRWIDRKRECGYFWRGT